MTPITSTKQTLLALYPHDAVGQIFDAAVWSDIALITMPQQSSHPP